MVWWTRWCSIQLWFLPAGTTLLETTKAVEWTRLATKWTDMLVAVLVPQAPFVRLYMRRCRVRRALILKTELILRIIIVRCLRFTLALTPPRLRAAQRFLLLPLNRANIPPYILTQWLYLYFMA